MNRIFRLFLLFSAAAAAAAGQTSPSSSPDAKQAEPSQSSPRKVDRGAAYYHYALAHMYEEQVTVYGRSDLAGKAIEEYRQAIEADPSSESRCEALLCRFPGRGGFSDLACAFKSDGAGKCLLAASHRTERPPC